MRQEASGRRVLIALLVGTAIVVLGSVAAVVAVVTGSWERQPEPVVAVLPFDGVSLSQENATLPVQVERALHDELAKVSGMSLVDPLLCSKIDRACGVPEAASSLGADYVVRGSVAQERDAVAVHAYLIRADASLVQSRYGRCTGAPGDPSLRELARTAASSFAHSIVPGYRGTR